MNNKRKTSALLCLILFLVALGCNNKEKLESFKKQDLKVLYVGGSGNWSDKHYKNTEERQVDIIRRKSSFQNMLATYFSDVTVMDASDYNQEVSNGYDVTVIDGMPIPFTPYQMIKDSLGKFIKRVPGQFFHKDFTKPVLFIGEVASGMAESVGSKFDWYCLCMDAHAYNYNQNHPIFNEPFPVTITTEEVKTPENAYTFEHFFDNSVPKTLPMWRVQTKGYKTDPGFRVGLVSRPGGFKDSPEAEFISTGVCGMRNFDAVALGRHGNFFHWGFAASPEFMTKESQTVLANAIIYISKFEGKGIIARKYNRTISTRGQSFREAIYFIDRKVYEAILTKTRAFEKRTLEEKSIAKRKLKNGEALSDKEKRALNYKPQSEQTYVEFLKYHHGNDLFNRFGTNASAYKNYYVSNQEYFYSDSTSYSFILDEDAKSLGIPNNDKRLIDECIKMLEQNLDINKAIRILKRYTLLDFETTPEWRSWYESNKEKLFFTEAGGFKFLVNSYDKRIIGNTYPNPF